jgi:hypothetical protein
LSKRIIGIFVFILLVSACLSSIDGRIKIFGIITSGGNRNPPTIVINIAPYEVIYEGDVIDCEIIGDSSVKYWKLNNQSRHTTFFGDDPIIFDPEPTPLDEIYVNLTVYAENEYGTGSYTIPIIVKKIFFGDIHWHTVFSDGDFDIDTMYQNAITDDFLDFAACCDHGELLDGFNLLFKGYPRFGGIREWDFFKTIIEKLRGFSEWQTMKDKAIEYYQPGNFSTLLGFEWTAAEWSPGGHEWSPNGCEDVGHINFYYKDIYQDAGEYSDLQKINYNSIFDVMAHEWDRGNLNIGFPHHPQGKASWVSFTTNWTFLAKGMKNTNTRDLILRGVEVYSRWGTAIGQHYTPDFPWLWPYIKDQFYNQTDSWVENALWEWSDPTMKGKQFSFIASSDTHDYNRPGSALFNESHLAGPSGILAVYAVHNTREEIWDALNNCTCYAIQLLKMRAYASFDGQLAYGRWINCTSPLEIRVSAYSTFNDVDRNGKNMYPHGYSLDELDYTISDIWLVKKDREKGRPWCKVIGHVMPNTNYTLVTFNDPDVKPNDFYWITIMQKGKKLNQYNNAYITFLGPVFIDQVEYG